MIDQDIATIRANATAWLANHNLIHGVGTKEAACSMAAINIAIDGRVNDKRPDCVCPAIHAWIIPIQDALPTGSEPWDLNGAKWKALLPLVAGTNDGRGGERKAIILDHMWTVTLPLLQGVADQGGFGAEWRTMCVEKTTRAAAAARASARASASASASASAASAVASAVAASAYSAVSVSAAASASASAAAAFATSASSSPYSAVSVSAAASASASASASAVASAAAASASAFWRLADIPALLERLVNLPVRT